MSTTTELEKLDISTFPELQGWKEKQMTIVNENPFIEIVDNKTYEDGKKARTTLVTARTTIEKQDKLIASKLTEIRKKVSGATQELVNITLPHEEKQQEEVRRYETVKEAERVAKEKAEKERKDAIELKIENFYKESKSNIESMTFDEIDSFKTNFQENLDKTDVVQFEEFELQFASKSQLLKQQLDDKIQVLTEKETQRIEAEKLAKAKADFEAEKAAKAKADKAIEDKRIADQKVIDDENERRAKVLSDKEKVIEEKTEVLVEKEKALEDKIIAQSEPAINEIEAEVDEIITAIVDIGSGKSISVESILSSSEKTETEVEIFNEIKTFLINWNNGEYSNGDTNDSLQDFHDRLLKIK